MRYFKDALGRIVVDRGLGLTLGLGAPLVSSVMAEASEAVVQRQKPPQVRIRAEGSGCSSNEYEKETSFPAWSGFARGAGHQTKWFDCPGGRELQCCRLELVWNGIAWTQQEICRVVENTQKQCSVKNIVGSGED